MDVPSEGGTTDSLLVVKKALVSREDIADDTLGDEDWNVISASRFVIQKTMFKLPR